MGRVWQAPLDPREPRNAANRPQYVNGSILASGSKPARQAKTVNPALIMLHSTTRPVEEVTDYSLLPDDALTDGRTDPPRSLFTGRQSTVEPHQEHGTLGDKWFASMAAEQGTEYRDDYESDIAAEGIVSTVKRTAKDMVDSIIRSHKEPVMPVLTEQLYDSAEFGEIINRDPPTIRQWISQGILPPGPYNSKGDPRTGRQPHHWPLSYVNGITELMRACKCIKKGTNMVDTAFTRMAFEFDVQWRASNDLPALDLLA